MSFAAPEIEATFSVDTSAPAGGRRSLVACLTAAPRPADADLARRARGAGWLRLDADRAGDIPAAWLRERFPGRLIYASRADVRAERLARAAAQFDLIELDAQRELCPEVLSAIPPAQRLLAWRGPPADAPTLAARLRRLTATPARFYLLTVSSTRIQDALPPLELLRAERRPDLIAYAEGEPGLWGRVLSTSLGAPLVFGAADGDDGSGEPELSRLVDDYGLPELPRIERLFGIVGDSVAHSLSPRLHNAAYRTLGLPALFVPFPVAAFELFWRDLAGADGPARLGLPLEGLTVASPYKEWPTHLAPAASRTARQAGSSNLVYRRRGAWFADTTDPDSVIETLRRRGLHPSGQRAAVVGCGGSGRAIAAALSRTGARVVLMNRSRPRGEAASLRLGLPFVPLAAFDPGDYDLVINATPVGRYDEDPPFAVGRLAADATVIDLVYARGVTPLVAAAQARGLGVIGGREVLLVQAARQFARMTGREMPEHLSAELLGIEEPALPKVRSTFFSWRTRWGRQPISRIAESS